MKQLIILFICLLNSHIYACINHYSPYREHLSLCESGELYLGFWWGPKKRQS